MGNNYTRILMHFGLKIDNKLNDKNFIKNHFKYTTLLKLFGGSLQGLEEIDDYLKLRIKALQRLQRANQNFKNRLIKQIIKQNGVYND